MSNFIIHIRLFGSIGAAARLKEDEVEIPPGTTIRRLLQKLAADYGEDFCSEVIDENGAGGLRDDVMITLGGEIVNHDNADQVILNPGDKIGLFPVFAGGG